MIYTMYTQCALIVACAVIMPNIVLKKCRMYKNQNSNLEHCGYLLVHTGACPVNEPSALQVLVRSPPVWVYPVLQEYVTAAL